MYANAKIAAAPASEMRKLYPAIEMPANDQAALSQGTAFVGARRLSSKFSPSGEGATPPPEHEAGPSHAIVESEVALSVLALPWPMLGTPNIEAFLGAGDLVFTALYVAVARRHGLSLARTAVALVLAYVATMAAVIVLAATLPALPFLGLGMLLVHPSARKPPAQDRVRGTVVAALVVGAVALMFLL